MNHGQRGYSYRVLPSYNLSGIFADAVDVDAIRRKREQQHLYVDSTDVRGIWPTEIFAPGAASHFPEKRVLAARPAVFCLLEYFPPDDKRQSNPFMIGRLFRKFHDSQGVVLLGVDIDESDAAYVADFALKMFDPAKGETEGESSTRYLDNSVRLADYTGQERFLHPEVVVLNPVPLSRASVIADIDLDHEHPILDDAQQITQALRTLSL